MREEEDTNPQVATCSTVASGGSSSSRSRSSVSAATTSLLYAHSRAVLISVTALALMILALNLNHNNYSEISSSSINNKNHHQHQVGTQQGAAVIHTSSLTTSQEPSLSSGEYDFNVMDGDDDGTEEASEATNSKTTSKSFSSNKYEEISCQLVDGTTVTLPKRGVPGFLVIGTPKGGTFALRDFFAKLPGFLPSLKIEPHYFDRAPTWMPKRADQMTDAHMCQAKHDYLNTVWRWDQLGPVKRRNKMLFEKTPSYLKAMDVANKVHRIYGGGDDDSLKFLMILRNPVERIYSAYKMYHRVGHYGHVEHMPNTFDDLVRMDVEELRAVGLTTAPALDEEWERMPDEAFLPNQPISERPEVNVRAAAIYNGVYSTHLYKWYQLFDARTQLKPFYYEDMTRNHTEVMIDLLQFLDRPDQIPYLSSVDMEEPLKSTSTPKGVQPMSNRTREYLNRFYRPYNEELTALLGNDRWKTVWARKSE